MSNVLSRPGFDDVTVRLAEVWRLSCTGRMHEAVALASRMLTRATRLGDSAARAGCSFHIAQCFFQIGRCDSALDHAQAAARMHEELGMVADEARARALYAWLLGQKADTDLALDEALRALDLARRSADAIALSDAHNTLGVVYWMIKQPEKALAFLQEAVEIARRSGDMLRQGRWLINLAGAQIELGYQARDRGDDARMSSYTNLAIETAGAALSATRSVGDSWAERIALCNLAEYHFHNDDLAAAEACLAQHDTIGGVLGDRARCQHEFTRGLVLAGRQRFDEAVEYFLKSLASEAAGDIEQAVLSSEHLARTYEAAGRFAEALAEQKRFHAFYVRLAEERIQRRARDAALRFENEQLRAQASEQKRRAVSLETQNIDLMREAERLSRHALEDDLTSLANRRRLEAALFEVLVNGEHYAVAMIDVDHFKRINDGFSHQMGDAVLKLIGTIIRQCCRRNDLPARYGGEEFAVLMRGANQAIARNICERIRAAIAGHDWQGTLGVPDVTVSIGTAYWKEAESPTSVLAVADRRLYQAKADGRNRVVSHAPAGR